MSLRNWTMICAAALGSVGNIQVAMAGANFIPGYDYSGVPKPGHDPKLAKEVRKRLHKIRHMAAAGDPGVDVNDISIFFPVTQPGNNGSGIVGFPRPLLHPNDLNSKDFQGHPLLTDKIFKSIQNEATKQFSDSTFPQNNLSTWKIYSFRYDPCATHPGFADGTDPNGFIDKPFIPGNTQVTQRFVFAQNKVTQCLQQIRLIAQPDGPGSTPTQGMPPLDMAMHLVYTISQGLPSADDPIINELLDIKASSENDVHAKTHGVPLGIHPGLLASKDGDAFTNKVLKFLKDHISADNLSGVAFMGTPSGFPWHFMVGGIFPPPGQATFDQRDWQIIPIANGPPGSAPNILFNGSGITPGPALPDTSTNSLFSAFQANSLSAQQKKTIFEVDDPFKSSLANRDCMSCHSGSSREVSLRVDPSDPAIAGALFTPPTGITGYSERGYVTDSVWNVRNFGYFFTRASGNDRVLNESSVAANLVNRTQLLANPGFVCKQKVDAYKCFRGLTGTDGSANACLTAASAGQCVPANCSGTADQNCNPQ